MNLLNLSSAFLLGALHAIEPGHGKAALASYTLGNRRAKKHVITLLISMVLSHTLMLILIGVVITSLFPLFDTEKAEFYIGLFSPIILIGVGLFMLYKIRTHQHVCSPACKHHQNNNSLLTNHSQVNTKSAFTFANTENTPPVIHSQKTTATIGFLTGLIPCPSAIAAFFLSGQNGDLSNSIWYVLVYVIGFVSIMLSLTIVFIYIGDKLYSAKSTKGWANNLDKISAYLIILIGLYYLIYNGFFHHH
jgi:nickel/cobalt exporter